MRAALALLLLASTTLAQGRVYDRGCDVASRRSSRGGVACASIPAGSIAMDGHSILLGIAGVQTPTLVGGMTGHNTPLTNAIAGSRSSACISRYNGNIASVSGYSTLVWMCAINDFLDGVDALTEFNNVKPTFDAAVAAGKYVILVEELPCGPHGPCTNNNSADVLFYNGLLQAWASENGASARYVPSYVRFVVTDGGKELAPASDYGDGLHLNDGGTDAGTYLLATLISNAFDAGPVGAQAGGELVSFASGSNAAAIGAACACAAVKTDDGGTVTVTHTGTAYCSKQGLARTGITNGDLVACGANLPLIEPGYDGGLSLHPLAATTNNVSNPLNLSAGSWATQGVGGSAAPTVTGNFAVAPDGNTTATRVQTASTSSAADGSLIYNLTGCSTGAGQSAGLYFKGTSGSGSANLLIYDLGGGHHFVTVNYNATTWTQPVIENFTESDPATGYFMLGNANFYTGSGTAMPASDFLVWGAECVTSEVLPPLTATSYGAQTAAVSVTAAGNFVSMAATIDAPTSIKTGSTWAQEYFDASNDNKGYLSSTVATMDFRQATTSHTVDTTGYAPTVSVGQRVSGAYVASVKRACIRGICTSATPAALTLPTGAATLYIGGRQSAGSEFKGLIRGVSLSTTSGGSQ